ncbi:hypothetical protein GCM10009665_16160 [Kitasatospora nipponensis]|uniref:Methyltransferase domain-containing protein n=1 Tax=Kitasatospora nipponensis TaxID=258049 RepID=A0ABP4GIQ6_9ACTN
MTAPGGPVTGTGGPDTGTPGAPGGSGCTGDCSGTGFFDLLGETYDSYRPPDAARTRQEVDLLAAACARPVGTAVDLMCGQGRHSLELARRGWRVTAVDRVAGLLGLLGERARAQGLGDLVDIVRADAFEFRHTGRADLVALLGNSFGFAADRAACAGLLNALTAATAADGLLAVEVFDPVRRADRHLWSKRFPGGSLTKRRHWDPVGSTEHMRVDLAGTGPTRSTCYRQYTPPAEEFVALAGGAGWRARPAAAWPSNDSTLFLLRREAP